MEFIRKQAPLLVTGILVFHFILSFLVSSQESMTYDEKAHIPAAYSYVRYGDMRLNPEHPPLIKDLSGLFLLPLGLDFPLTSSEWQNGYNEQWAVGDMFINCSRPEIACNDADTILFFSRIPIIILAVILGTFLFLWTKELGGALAGVFAVTLYAFDPNIIAHSHYVTTDIGSAAFIFFSFYFFLRFLKDPTLRTMLFSGIFLGLAELTKFSAVLLFPVFGLFTILYALTRIQGNTDSRSSWRFKMTNLWRYLFSYGGSVIICFAVIWVGYALNTIGMPAEKVIEHADLFLSQPNAPARITHDLIVGMAHSPILLPFAEYFVGIAKVFSRVAAGNVHYFLGTVSVDASPWYFPVVFFLKETLPFLFLLFATALYSLYRMVKHSHVRRGSIFTFLSHSFQQHTTSYIAVFFILFYSYVSITGNLTIGFRHLFPILPFLYLLIGKTLADFYKRHREEPHTHQLIAIIYGIIFFSIMTIPLLTYPSYLSYFNAIAGGHQNGYHYVTDSNYDWGQDLKYLKKFVEKYNAPCPSGIACILKPPIDKIRVDYFGGSDPKYYLGDKYIPWWGGRRPIEPGWYAICTFFYQESLYKKLDSGELNYSWLKDKTPVARAGDSFLIYYISEADIATLKP